MSLDDKLKEIVNAHASIDEVELGEDKFVGHHNVDEAIAQIKQAFADEGFIKADEGVNKAAKKAAGIE